MRCNFPYLRAVAFATAQPGQGSSARCRSRMFGRKSRKPKDTTLADALWWA